MYALVAANDADAFLLKMTVVPSCGCFEAVTDIMLATDDVLNMKLRIYKDGFWVLKTTRSLWQFMVRYVYCNVICLDVQMPHVGP